ncbi:hypothetical protein CYLTODRAFT_275560 [Cylindrobasidium torrendii FP15055 ss-10]|uniref:Uncharacterized protein n=1 Tax=Cylindrobasidium torrendii FP15055 ss-10 TaxID=1314674 RepID=A0A0D7BCV7_9AGAR|nr:hypothetical protein CYLTODRAFT_275560 [Cylindrobasidium torrendii FP15055 ss-10]
MPLEMFNLFTSPRSSQNMQSAESPQDSPPPPFSPFAFPPPHSSHIPGEHGTPPAFAVPLRSPAESRQSVRDSGYLSPLSQTVVAHENNDPPPFPPPHSAHIPGEHGTPPAFAIPLRRQPEQRQSMRNSGYLSPLGSHTVVGAPQPEDRPGPPLEDRLENPAYTSAPYNPPPEGLGEGYGYGLGHQAPGFPQPSLEVFGIPVTDPYGAESPSYEKPPVASSSKSRHGSTSKSVKSTSKRHSTRTGPTPPPKEVVSSFVEASFSSETSSRQTPATPAAPAPKPAKHVPRKYRAALEAEYGSLPAASLLTLLISSSYECSRLRKALSLALERLREEGERTERAYGFAEELVGRITKLHSQKVEMRQALGDARETIERWRVEYDHVKGRVEEGETLMSRVKEELGETRRKEREARKEAWRAERDRVQVEAVEQGRRKGMADGYKRALAEARPQELIYTEELADELPEIPSVSGSNESDEEDDEVQTPVERQPSHSPPPIVGIATSTNSPPARPSLPPPSPQMLPPPSPQVETWTTEVPQADGRYSRANSAHGQGFATPPDHLIPHVGPDGKIIPMPPAHEFDTSMRAASPNRASNQNLPDDEPPRPSRGRYGGIAASTGSHARMTRPPGRAGSDSTTMSNMPMVAPLGRTDEWEDLGGNRHRTSTYAPAGRPVSTHSRQSRWERPVSYVPSFRNPDITPFDPGVTPSISAFQLPGVAQSGASVRTARTGKSRSRLSVANPDPEPEQSMYEGYGGGRAASDARSTFSAHVPVSTKPPANYGGGSGSHHGGPSRQPSTNYGGGGGGGSAYGGRPKSTYSAAPSQAGTQYSLNMAGMGRPPRGPSPGAS